LGRISLISNAKNLWKEAFYYCTKNDPVPKLQKVFGKIPPATENVFFLDTGKKTDFGHRFDHPVYQPYLEEHFNNYIRGIYD